MKKNIFIIALMSLAAFSSCVDDVLNRPELSKPVDNNFWRNEADFRMYVNDYYTNYFVGYNSGWSTAWGAGAYGSGAYVFSDDVVTTGKQPLFTNTVPSSRYSTSLTPDMLTEYSGANWNFAWVRKTNLLMERLETYKDNLTAEAYEHWMGVAKFFKGYEYYRLVCSFGDVPWYETTVQSDDFDTQYKDRDSRETVMDNVYALFADAMTKIRTSDGDNMLNRYVAAGFISRVMLFEGTWQKYHNNNTTLANKYLQQAVDAAEIVMNSGKYAISGDFRSLFCTQDLKGHPEMLMYRVYDASQSVTHMQASYSNGVESQSRAANLAFAKSFICSDGKVYQNSTLENGSKLDLQNMLKTRDSRFEAMFRKTPDNDAASLLYVEKFCPREGTAMETPGTNPIYGSNTNTNDAPVIRYSEVLLNWIEAKAELGTAGQADIDKSINALRDRDLAPEAIALGVQKTAHLTLPVAADFDPARDADVDPLIWEIRRERRMELAYEHSRLADIRRWKKLDYMDNEKYPDTMLGLWINMSEELPALLDGDKDGNYIARQVMKEDGTVVTYDGSNAADMVGYYVPLNAQPRDVFSDRNYLAPVGELQISTYSQKGYTLTQTKGW